jgi:hypothetical protein
MNPIEGVCRNNKLLGWVQKRARGGWRALTLSGVLTHHQSRESAREAVRWSM